LRLNSVELTPWRTGALAVVLAGAVSARAADRRDLVILDEDWNVPGDAICEANIPLLLHSPSVRLLALTGVTGDAWCTEGVANALRFMEEVGRTDIPVARGATWPLLNTSERLAAWERRFGALSWRGAWNSPAHEAGDPHPETPFAIRPAREGLPTHPAAAESAPALMVRLVHEHPHQITFACGGPLTNLALAVRMDPEFSHLAKRLVLGLSVGGVLTQHPGSTQPNFNERFDPEAAHIVLTAGWDEVVVIDTANSDPPLTAAIVERIQRHPTAASAFLVANGKLGLPLWAMHVAIVADPALVRLSERLIARLDVGIDDRAPTFGSTVVPDAAHYAGPPGGQAFTWVYAVDLGRYVDDFVQALQAP
jgi:inosine-uridine nucleoside N-ribohydrolase